MRNTARMLIARAKGTVSGTFVDVGWMGDNIGAGEVRKTLPHERVVIKPNAKLHDVVLELNLAAARIADQMPDALAKMRARKTKPVGLFTKPGLYRKKP